MEAIYSSVVHDADGYWTLLLLLLLESSLFIGALSFGCILHFHLCSKDAPLWKLLILKFPMKRMPFYIHLRSKLELRLDIVSPKGNLCQQGNDKKIQKHFYMMQYSISTFQLQIWHVLNVSKIITYLLFREELQLRAIRLKIK